MPSIKNINGTSDNKCNCENWVKHWEKYSKRSIKYCSAYGCMEETNIVGAHVQKSDQTDSMWYIIPLCHTHNMSKEELRVSDGTVFISANVSKTCG